MDEIILDMRAIDEAKTIMKAKFSTMVGYFTEDAENYIKGIKIGLIAKDLAVIASIAHTLKSSSLQLGAAKLGGIARQIEEIARNSKNTEEISVLSIKLEEAFLQTSQAIKNL